MISLVATSIQLPSDNSKKVSGVVYVEVSQGPARVETAVFGQLLKWKQLSLASHLLSTEIEKALLLN